MAKKPTLILPVCTLIYPKLSEIDVYQPRDDKGNPTGEAKRRWMTYAKFEPADHKSVNEWLEKIGADAGLDDRFKMPWKKDKKTGEKWLTVASGEKYKPAFYDAKNRKVPDIIIGGGTKAKLFVTANPYKGFGGGINLYLKSVQVIELKEGFSGKSPFEETEGYEGPEEDEEEKSPFDPHAGSSSDMDDEIPF